MSLQNPESVPQEPNDQVSCPIDELHKLNRKNLLRHILKCYKQYGGDLVWAFCPYNVIHIVKKEKLLDHIKECPDLDVPKEEEEKDSSDEESDDNFEVVDDDPYYQRTEEYW